LTRKFLPDERTVSVYSVDYTALRQQGIRGLLFDLDNTLGPHRFLNLEERACDLIRQLEIQGFRIALISNHSGHGRERMGEKIPGILIFFNAKKPFRSSFERALAALQISSQETAMVGDQLLTDVLGAKRCGLYTVLVEPVDPRSDPLSIRWRRWVERKILHS
jgi:HAD superfamily phosphatase (TIGR01668 family)